MTGAAVIELRTLPDESRKSRPGTPSGTINIAYQVTGQGPLDLVLVPGFVSHLENDWDEPRSALFLERLFPSRGLVRFDKRSTGSPTTPPGCPISRPAWTTCVAVMDAVGSERAAFLGYSEGGPMSVLFAATIRIGRSPSSCTAATPSGLDPDDDYPWAATRSAGPPTPTR